MDTGNIGQGVVVIENTSDKGNSVQSESKQSSIPKQLSMKDCLNSTQEINRSFLNNKMKTGPIVDTM